MNQSSNTTGYADWEASAHKATGAILSMDEGNELQSEDSTKLYYGDSEATFYECEWWNSNNSASGLSVLTDIDSHDYQVDSIEPILEVNTISIDRSTLFMMNPMLLNNSEKASREVNARLKLLEDRLMKMVPVRSDEELAEVENFIDAIEKLSNSLE